MLKAVFAKGRIVTGVTHGDAFGKLPKEEREGNNFMIGSWCNNTGRFVTDNGFFFAKQIFLIRHATPSCSYEINQDPHLSPEGISESNRLGRYLRDLPELMDRSRWSIQCSPMSRCIETMTSIQKFLNLEDNINDALLDSEDDYIEALLESLPPKVILISHCMTIRKIIQFVEDVGYVDIAPASISYIDHQHVVYSGKCHA